MTEVPSSTSTHPLTSLAIEAPQVILARLERSRDALCGAEAILAFDADGTLWSGDVGVDFFEALLSQRAVRDAAREALVSEAKAFGIAHSGDATRVAASLYEAFQHDRYPEDRAFAMMAWVFAGYTLEEVARWARDVVREVSLGERIHARIRPILDWAQAESVPVYVVSASVQVIVIEGAGKLGIPADRIIATAPATRNGTIVAAIEGEPVYGEQKVTAIRAARPDAVILGAFGDSGFDAPLLRQAKVPVAVLPKPGLLARAGLVPGLVAIGE